MVALAYFFFELVGRFLFLLDALLDALAVAAALVFAFLFGIVRCSGAPFFLTGIEGACWESSLLSSVEELEGDVMVKWLVLLIFLLSHHQRCEIVASGDEYFLFVDTMNVFRKLRRKVYQNPVEIYTKGLIPALHTVQKWTYLSGKSILGPNRIK